MPFKHLEHNGDEDFKGLSKRKIVDKELEIERNERISDEAYLEQEQKNHMNPNNEDLWDDVDL